MPCTYFSSVYLFNRSCPIRPQRYIGKEVIGVLGYRFGKSGTSLAVSALTSQFGFGITELSWLTCAASLVWTSCTWRLSHLVPTKAEAEEAFAKIHGKSGGKKKRK